MNDMTLVEIFLFVLAGCGAGFLAGLFGVGGGIILVPILVFSYEYLKVSSSVLTHIAMGTSLFVIFFASLFSAYQHRKQGNVNFRAFLILGVSSIFTALIAAKLASEISGLYLRFVFALIVVTTGIFMLAEKESQAIKKIEFSSRPNPIHLAGTGLIAGTISALAGIGGGVITIPMMYYLIRMPLKMAIGTSSATIVITSLFALIGYVINGLKHPGLPSWSVGFVDLQRGVVLAIGTVIFARVGAYVSFKTHPFRLRKCFAIYNIIVSIYMFFK